MFSLSTWRESLKNLFNCSLITFLWLSEKLRSRHLARLMWSKGTCYRYTSFLCSKNWLLMFLKKKVDRQDLILIFYFDSNIAIFLYFWWQYQMEQLPMDFRGTLFHSNHIDFYLMVLVISQVSGNLLQILNNFSPDFFYVSNRYTMTSQR